MSHAEKGIYIDLLALNWLHGCLSFEQCLRGCFVSPGSQEAETLRAILDEKFDVADGLYFNRRIEEERMKQRARSDAGSKGGKKSQANRKQNAKQNASKASSKTVSKQASKRQHSDSVSDSVSVLSSGSNSEKYSHTDTHAEVPEQYAECWERWCLFREAIDGRPPNAISAEANLMELMRRGPEKAARDIEFSIRKSARTILDSDNDFEKRGGQAKVSRSKNTITEI